MQRETYDRPPRLIDGTPACDACGSIRMRRPSVDWMECLSCGSRFAMTPAAAGEVRGWRAAEPDDQPPQQQPAAPPAAPQVAARGSTPGRPGRRMGVLSAAVVVIMAAAVWLLFFRGSKPDGCTTISGGELAQYNSNLAPHRFTAADVDQAAELQADGGTYVVGRINDAGQSTVVWFRTPSGTTYSVGAVTALYSSYPDSSGHTQASVGSDGYHDAIDCLG